ncbi:MAG: SH3 domain-containing protein, partial [Nannocystaceae bacterium]|nr:SH3 domain-containing protein [Nannocystaceae bacterium]
MSVVAGNRARRWGLSTLAGGLLGCSGPTHDRTPGTAASAPAVEPDAKTAGAARSCPTESIARTVAPNVTPRLRQVETWLGKFPTGVADTVLLDLDGLPALNAQFAAVKGAFRDPMAAEVGDPAQVAASIAERGAWMRARVEEGHYQESEPGALAVAERLVARAAVVDELRIMVEEAPLWCVPLATGLFKPPVDPAFDRNRCASLHPGELVRVLRRTQTEPHWLYVDSGHTTGWLQAPTVTPDLPREHLAPLWHGPHLLPLRDDVTTSSGHPFRLGTRLPLQGEQEDVYRVLVPTAQGPKPATVPRSAAVVVGPQPLTRRALWGMALAEL